MTGEFMWVYCSTQQTLSQIFRRRTITSNGTSQGEPVTLVQTTPFHLGSTEDHYQYWQVHALMRKSEVFVDRDDYDAIFCEDLSNAEYLTTPISELSWKDPSGVGYGLFCRDIPLHRVSCIELVTVDEGGISSTVRVYSDTILEGELE